MIFLEATGTWLKATSDEILTTNTVGTQAQLTVDDAWNGLTITVVFRVDDVEYIAPLVDGLYSVPWEVFLPANEGKVLQAGICGTMGDVIVYPTIYANLYQLAAGTNPNAAEGADPTPSGFQQILGLATSAYDMAQSALDVVNNADNSDSGMSNLQIGVGLKIEDNKLMVDASDTVQNGDTRPVTSAAVSRDIGNINVLLANI